MPTLLLVALIVAVALAAFLLLRGRGAAPGDTGRPLAARSSSSSNPSPSAPNRPRVNWLVGTAGPVAGKTFHVGYRTATIGRSATNLVQIDHEDVSRKHCQLSPHEGGLQVIDMQSENGTFIGDAAVSRAVLRVGDELRIGPARFVFQISADYAKDAAQEVKSAGAGTAQTTAALEGGGLQVLVEAKLRKHGGDIEATALELGVEPNLLQRLVDEGKVRRPE